MAVFAGAYFKHAEPESLNRVRLDLAASVGRSDPDSARSYLQHCAAVAVSGRFSDLCKVIADERGTTIVAGDPVVTRGHPRKHRETSADVGWLHQRLADGDSRALADCAGTFCGAHLPPSGGPAFLFTDRIGLRQLFYADTRRVLYFSSALWVLEALPGISRPLDVHALAESTTLRYSTADKTPYRSVRLLQPASVLSVSTSTVEIGEYWSWPDTEPGSPQNPEYHVERCYEEFVGAVRVRAQGDSVENSFLSGGLDSRAIVAALRMLDKPVRTYNFAAPASQDNVFAERFARSIGTTHVQLEPRNPDEGIEVMFGRIRDLENGVDPSGEPGRSLRMWSGYGGSGPLGLVDHSESIVDALRSGETHAAVAAYMQARGFLVARRPYRRALYEQIRDWPREALLNELQPLADRFGDKGFYHLLLRNLERRCLHSIYETLDIHGIEPVLPFYDLEFLIAVSAVPIDLALYHRFYHQWITRFPEPAHQTPWQSYPGHEPCPVNGENEMAENQWEHDRSAELSAIQRRLRLRMAKDILASGPFPTAMLSLPAFVVATLACLAGSSRLHYVIDDQYEFIRRSRNATASTR